MFQPDVLFGALGDVFALANFLAMACGVLAGIVIGALPGLSATMAISVLIPLTFFMSPLQALGMIAGIYNGAMYGGSIPAILLRIPGTPAAVATCFDGYPMAQKGEAGWALQVACVSSAIGGVASAIALIAFAPPLARLTIAFGPSEIFWVAIFGLAAISLFVGDDPVKGLLAAMIGVIVSLVGTDSITGADRFTFGQLELLDGVSVIVLLVGLYAMAPVFDLLESEGSKAAGGFGRIRMEPIRKRLRDLIKLRWVWLRSSLIGIFVGILPGAGGSLAAFLSYNETMRAASPEDRKLFGHGDPRGVAAAECGNNADNAAALIPALSLGIPGSSVTAVILGGLLVHGLQPGPELFRSHPDIVYGFMFQMMISSVMLLFLGGPLATNTFARLLAVPRPLLAPIILSLMTVGVYSIQNSMFDVWMMVGFGVLGYVMTRLRIPMAPVVLGLILGAYAETNFRLAMMIGRNDVTTLWDSTIAKIIILLTVVILGMPLVRAALARLRGPSGDDKDNGRGKETDAGKETQA